MSLWYESLGETLYDVGNYFGVDPDANLSVQREQALWIVRYLSMDVPRQWWESSIREGRLYNEDLLHSLYKELQKLPQLTQRIDHALLVALAFIDDPEKPRQRTYNLSLEGFFLAAEKLLAERPDLRRFGEKIKDRLAPSHVASDASAPLYGLFRHEYRMYYADTYGAYVFQVEPFPAAWQKSGRHEKWKRTRKLPLELRHLMLGRLHKEPIMEMGLPNCRLLRWKAANTEFSYEPDWDDSVPLERWKKSNEMTPILALFAEKKGCAAEEALESPQDWVSQVSDFMRSVRPSLLALLKGFPAGSWELLEAAHQWEGFEDLMEANPALAVCLALRVRVGKQPGVRRKPLDYGRLVGRRQREIAAAIGFGDSESIVSILKKVVLDACTPRDLSFLCDLIHDPLIMPHLQNAQQISGPAIYLLQDPMLRGNLGGDFITDVSKEFPRTDDITTVAEGARQLRGGTKQRDHSNLNMELRDLVRFNPDIVIQSIGDFRAKHAAMIKKLNNGAISKRILEFPKAPFVGTEYIQHITTANELALEGKEMHHCVRSYLRDIFKGLVSVYRVMSPERATLSLERGPHGWRLGQLKLQDNGTPSGETVEFVNAWLKAKGVRIGRTRKK